MVVLHPTVDATQKDDDLARFSERLEAMDRKVSEMAVHQLRMNEIAMALFARLGDPTHLTVPEVARIRGVSEKTIRRAIDREEMTLEAVPGKQGAQIPIAQIYDRWIPLRTLRAARLREAANSMETLAS